MPQKDYTGLRLGCTASVSVVGYCTDGVWFEHRNKNGRYYVFQCGFIKCTAIGKNARQVSENPHQLFIISGKLQKDKMGLICFTSQVQPLNDFVKQCTVSLEEINE